MALRLGKGSYSTYSVLSANLMADLFFFHGMCVLADRVAGGLPEQGSSNET